MRRLTDLKPRIAKRCLIERQRIKPTSNRIIEHDILLVLSKYDNRINKIYKFPKENAFQLINIISPWKKFFEKNLYFEERTNFDISLEPFINLETLIIKEASVFNFESLKNSNVRKLFISSVKKIIFKNYFDNSKIEEINLKNITLDLDILLLILKWKSVIKISLNNIIIKNENWKTYFFKSISTMQKLIFLELINVGISAKEFSEFYNEKYNFDFILHEENNHAEFRQYGLKPPKIKFSGTLEYFKFLNIEMIEMAYIESTDLKYFIEMKCPNIKSLHFKDAIVDIFAFKNFFLKLNRIEELEFTKCVFDHLSFYEIIAHFKATLRYLVLRSSNLPHDYINFLISKLKFCTVVLKDGSVKLVKNSNTVQK